MNATPRPCLVQRDCARQAHTTNSLQFFNMLTSDALLDNVEKRLPDHRERLFPPTETLSMFLAQTMSGDRSCQQAVNQATIQRLVEGLKPCSTHTGGYCKARQRLPTDLISGLTQDLAGLIGQKVPSTWSWHGRRLLLVDGTTVTMPDTPANQAKFPQQGAQKPGLGFPICRLVGITCLSSGALLNAAIGPFNGKGSGEQSLLRELQDTFEAGDIVIADAFFSTYFLLAAMQQKQIDIVMEQHGARKRVTDFRRGQRLGVRDHVIVIHKPEVCPDWMSAQQFEQAPATLKLRELKVMGKVLITTLNIQTASKKEVGKLYKDRWHVELDIRHIKDTMGMNVLSCKTPEMVIKEIWVYLLAYNLIRFMMSRSALLCNLTPRRLSFKHCLQLWLIWAAHRDLCSQQQQTQLLLLMAQQKVGNRPGRIEPRAVKRRPKSFSLLTIPRQQARDKVREYGHPKKLK